MFCFHPHPHPPQFEGGGGSRNGILTYPTLKDIGGPFSLKETLLWYDFLLASLDCYTWAFGEQLLSPKDVFDGSFPDAKYTSVLFKSLHHFLSDLAMFGIQAASDCFTRTATRSYENLFSPKEIDEYNRARLVPCLPRRVDRGYSSLSTKVFVQQVIRTAVVSCLHLPLNNWLRNF
ncbi:hypothetical protein QZH41_002350 [Actinostola sp. cb2023]|nr:hypothetical protein QZH41_002350 [Actinostola sp. cb2023]